MADPGADAHLARAFALTGPADARALYDEWAATYDDDVAGTMGYVAPEVVADRVAALVPPDTDVLDAGCGTGLVGAALAGRGFRSVDGLDISTGMLARARKRRVYHDLGPADLTQRLPGAADKFGVVTCVGTLTRGHVGPSALHEFARVVRPGGLIVATVLSDVWEAQGYDRALAELEAHGTARVVEVTEQPYRTAQGATCRLLVLEVVKGFAGDTAPGR